MNRLQAACRALIIWDAFMKKTDRIRKTLSVFINPISAIILITCLAVGIFHAASHYYINMLFDRVESQYRQGSINIVSVARNSIEPILKKVRSREISRLEAIERIRPIIRNMTYNDQAGKNYILMTTYDGTTLVQPYQTHQEMKNHWEFRDVRGVYMLQELTRAARAHPEGSFVSYHYYHFTGRKIIEKKLTYVLGLPEIDCYIGTGMYMDKIIREQREILAKVKYISFFMIIMILVPVLFSIFIILNRNRRLIAEIEIREKAEKDLRISETNLLAIFNSSHDAMVVHDEGGAIYDVNERMLEMFGLAREQALLLNIRDICAPGTDMNMALNAWKTMTVDTKELIELNAIRPGDRSIFPVEVGLKQLKQGDRFFVLATVRDVTVRKGMESALRESLEEKDILIKEIHHRVKNNMQIITSLLNMQIDVIREPVANAALKDAVARIHSMASIHEKIYRSENLSRIDMAGYIEGLSADLVAMYSSEGKVIHVDQHLKTVFLGLRQAIPCGLLMNEILTNSIKHGCTLQKECRIDISLEEAEGWITLTIRDYGPGIRLELFKSDKKTTTGMQIIEALTNQIGARIELNTDNGTMFTIRFRVSS